MGPWGQETGAHSENYGVTFQCQWAPVSCPQGPISTPSVEKENGTACAAPFFMRAEVVRGECYSRLFLERLMRTPAKMTTPSATITMATMGMMFSGSPVLGAVVLFVVVLPVEVVLDL